MAKRVQSDELLRRYAQGERDFENADLKQGHLRRANISGANLRGASLRGADLCWANLTGANLMGAKLTSAELTGAKLRAANFRGCRLCGANLSEADLREAMLRDADLRRANLTEASLSKAELLRADLFGANLSAADLNEANLTMASLRAANLHKGDLYRAKLCGADLSEADLTEADLSGADLSGADLRQANLTGANLSEANLTNATLAHAELRDANLDGATLDGCSFSPGADLLAAQWNTLSIADNTYHRDAVELGQQTLPVGQANPLRFVFAIDGELGGEDLHALREVIRGIGSAEGTAVELRITESRELLVVEGLGTPARAGQAGVLLQLVQHAAREGSRTQLEGSLAEHRQDHAQRLIALALVSLRNDGLLRLLKRVQLREIELRDEQEARKFQQVVRDWDLDKYVTVVERTARFVKAFVCTSEATGFLLSSLGLAEVAEAIGAGMQQVKGAKRRESEFNELLTRDKQDVG
jgi:uncharacterized protein YjbI with pentapeptide repeats